MTGLGRAAPQPLVLQLALRPQAQHPHGPPRQPVRGPPRRSGPPWRLVAARPRRLFPWQDGIPGGGGGRRRGFASGAGGARGPTKLLPGAARQGPHARGRPPARARTPRPAPPAGVCQVFAEALQAYGVRFTRLPLERGVGGCTWLEAPARAFACAVERDARAAVGPFSRHGLRWTDAFVGLSTCGRHMSAHRVSGALARVLEGTLAGHTLTAELMAHPGYPSVPPTGGCGEGPDAFSCSWERLHELRVLTAPTLRTRLAQDGVQLCALDDLDSKRPGEEVPCEATLEPFLESSLL
ncbi:carbohydrate deacetylase isoform X5 [Rhinopithecus roxellana]|uniref:carbohydrate deacetylase isoform X5 n=1 Tax=Rhinopithecus roxellana TaxID=61622 RepID=UPI0012376788|nr:carbohydrate deacetylase isoform X5 [Rhinopithecus roxellana]